MANRYWVGGTNTNWITFGNWAATSGGPNTASVPTSADDVFFDANSGTGTVKIAASGNFQTAYANNLNTTGYAGTIDVGVAGGYFNKIIVSGNLIKGTAATFTNSNAANNNEFQLNGTSKTITSNGGTFNIQPIINAGASYTLADAFAADGITIAGTLTTSNYSMTLTGTLAGMYAGVTQGILNCWGASTFNMGSSTVTCGLAYLYTGAIINAGTSTLVFPTAPVQGPSLQIDGQTLYNVTAAPFNSGYASRGVDFIGAFTCNNLTLSGGAGIYQGGTVSVSANITVNGTFTVSGLSVKERVFFTGGSSGAGVTITANAASASYVDFQNIQFAGTAAPLTGTSLGNIKRNSGITFTAAKTVYFKGSSGAGWISSNVWATSSGGAGSDANYPLAQDTVIYDDNSQPSGATFDIQPFYTYGIVWSGNLSFASRTLPVSLQNGIFSTVSNVTLSSAVSTVTIGGRVTCFNNTPITITMPTGFGVQWLEVNCDGSEVTISGSISITNYLQLTAGTLKIGSSTITFTGSAYLQMPYGISPMEINTGSGVLDFQSTGNSGTLIDANSFTVVTIGGSGTIKSSNGTTSVKTINIPAGSTCSATIDQAGPGPLLIQNGGTFQNITNSYSATAATAVRLGANQTYTFTSFNLSGSSGKLCTLTCTTGRASIRKASGLWYMGLNSTNGGNNSGLVFTGGGGIDYLSVSNINGITEQNGALIFF